MVRASGVTALAISVLLIFAAEARSGPFQNPGVAKDDPAIEQWASMVVNYTPAAGVGGSFSNAANSLGTADGTIVSLGDLNAGQITGGISPGRITLDFDRPFADGPGWDLAVFENAGTFFTPPFVFAELAFVEVSSNGADFARFSSISLNVEPGQGVPGDTEIITSFGRAFAGVNATNVRNLAGIHPANVGTPFDLAELANDPLVQSGLVDLDLIRFIRLIDIPGNGSFLDSQGHPILDAWPTAGSGGLDLDAVAARYVVPEPATLALVAAAILAGIVAARWRVNRFA